MGDNDARREAFIADSFTLASKSGENITQIIKVMSIILMIKNNNRWQ